MIEGWCVKKESLTTGALISVAAGIGGAILLTPQLPMEVLRRRSQLLSGCEQWWRDFSASVWFFVSLRGRDEEYVGWRCVQVSRIGDVCRVSYPFRRCPISGMDVWSLLARGSRTKTKAKRPCLPVEAGKCQKQIRSKPGRWSTDHGAVERCWHWWNWHATHGRRVDFFYSFSISFRVAIDVLAHEPPRECFIKPTHITYGV
jgi:hypothetical protein